MFLELVKEQASIMEVAPIPVLRPSYLMDQFQGDLVEGPANIFYQKVNASRATLRRMQFQFRAPSDNLLASPIMFLRMTLKIDCPQVWNQIPYMNVHGVLGAAPDQANLGHVGISQATGVTAAKHKGQYAAGIAFADADALSGCCSSINFLFNGTSLGLNRTNRWFRDFTKCMISSDASAKIYKSSGPEGSKGSCRSSVQRYLRRQRNDCTTSSSFCGCWCNTRSNERGIPNG